MTATDDASAVSGSQSESSGHRSDNLTGNRSTTVDRQLAVPHHAHGARLARHQLATDLAGIVGADLVADAVAVTAELVGNAIRHAQPLPGGVVRVTWELNPDDQGTTVEIRVEDGGSCDDPQVRCASPESVDGRGLAIVAALAQRWGSERTDGGRVVWARLHQDVGLPVQGGRAATRYDRGQGQYPGPASQSESQSGPQSVRTQGRPTRRSPSQNRSHPRSPGHGPVGRPVQSDGTEAGASRSAPGARVAVGDGVRLG